MSTIEDFAAHLRRRGMSAETIRSYTCAAKAFTARFGEATPTSVLAYKGWLQQRCAPATVNLRINGINAWLRYLSLPDLQVKTVRIQGKPYLDNVITDRQTPEGGANGIAIYCKSQAVYGDDGGITAAAVWVDALGRTV